MRLKSYSAPSMAEAMAMVRAELGDDAIIVSTQRASGSQGVRITAALEEASTDDEIHQLLDSAAPAPVADRVREALVYHGLPPRLIEKIVTAARKLGTESATMACAAALDELFAFAPLPERRAPRPFMMVGPPGAGKTITVAKLAARARLAGRSVGVITADSVRAGALEQLSAFTSILDIDLRKVRGGDALREMALEAAQVYDLVFIDTPGLNPFHPQDMDFLREMVDASAVEPVLVMAAGGDPVEAEEVAEAFAEIGATRLLATRLDITRRLGAVLAAADTGQFMFCDVSINPHVANGLCPISPVSMARLLVPPTEEEEMEISGGAPPPQAQAVTQPPPASASAAPVEAEKPRGPRPFRPPPVDPNAKITKPAGYRDFMALVEDDAGEMPAPEAEVRPKFAIVDDFDPDDHPEDPDKLEARR